MPQGLLDLEHRLSIATVPRNVQVDVACKTLNLGFHTTPELKDGEIV